MSDLGQTDRSQRWVLWRFRADLPWHVQQRNTRIPAGDHEEIEVMPVAEHERLMDARCVCRVRCGDVPESEDDTGTCKGLPR